MYENFIKVQLLLFATVSSCYCYVPVVLWHGAAQACCSNNSTTEILQAHFKEYLPGIHVLSLQIGDSQGDDFANSIRMHPDKQIEIACNIIKSDPLLKNGYNAVGFSQGSQFLRGLLQRCPEPRMKTLVTMAGQHQGVYGFPHCMGSIEGCDNFRRFISAVAYVDLMQNAITQLTYWHNPLNEEAYIKGNTFLPDINNEKSINKTYIQNLQSLQNFIMVKYEYDKMVQPTETQWFGFFKPGQSEEIQTLRESDLYISDRLGLKQMDKDGKLHFLMAPWVHTQLDWPWFRDNIVDRFLV